MGGRDGHDMYGDRGMRDSRGGRGGGDARQFSDHRDGGGNRGPPPKIDGSQFMGGRYARGSSGGNLGSTGGPAPTAVMKRADSSASHGSSRDIGGSVSGGGGGGDASGAPRQRPSLKLLARTKPLEESKATTSQSSIFGGAKPRDETKFIAEKQKEEASKKEDSKKEDAKKEDDAVKEVASGIDKVEILKNEAREKSIKEPKKIEEIEKEGYGEAKDGWAPAPIEEPSAKVDPKDDSASQNTEDRSKGKPGYDRKDSRGGRGGRGKGKNRENSDRGSKHEGEGGGRGGGGRRDSARKTGRGDGGGGGRGGGKREKSERGKGGRGGGGEGGGGGRGNAEKRQSSKSGGGKGDNGKSGGAEEAGGSGAPSSLAAAAAEGQKQQQQPPSAPGKETKTAAPKKTNSFAAFMDDSDED